MHLEDTKLEKSAVENRNVYPWFDCPFCFLSADDVILKPSGTQLTVEFLEENSFSVPLLVLKKDGLGMTLPPASFTVRDVEHYVGEC